MIMDILETSHHTTPHYDSHRGYTQDEQQTNWIKDESLGYKGVEMWGVWGGDMGGERRVNHKIVLVM